MTGVRILEAAGFERAALTPARRSEAYVRLGVLVLEQEAEWRRAGPPGANALGHTKRWPLDLKDPRGALMRVLRRDYACFVGSGDRAEYFNTRRCLTSWEREAAVDRVLAALALLG